MPAARLVLQGVAAVLLPLVGVTVYVTSGDRHGQDPRLSLQQLDLLYLDEPAPGLAQTGAPAGQVVVLLFCRRCAQPHLARSAVVPVDDPALARQYGLGAPGRTGYAIVDRHGHVRYRSYDPHVAEHEPELQTLVDGVDG